MDELSMRPISEADSVLAVYYDNWGLSLPYRGGRGLIIAAWPDGTLVWSADRLKGGAPFRTGKTDPNQVTALLARLEKEGLFQEKLIPTIYYGADSAFNTVLVKSGKQKIELRSWHELGETSDKYVADSFHIYTLQGKTRLATLKECPKDYLLFRMVWNDIRRRLSDLIPAESQPCMGQTVLKAGVFTWVEKKGK